jgi:hypothetical protein
VKHSRRTHRLVQFCYADRHDAGNITKQKKHNESGGMRESICVQNSAVFTSAFLGGFHMKVSFELRIT